MDIDSESESQRQHLLGCLLDAVKQCQVRFGGQTELATETDSRISCLCATWEAALQHGMKHSNKVLSTLKQMTELTGLNKMKANIGLLDDICKMETEPAYWHYVQEHLNSHELERYRVLKHVDTDAGRGRAWLRSALNEHSLEKYMHMLVEDTHIISQFYEDWAFLMDQEKSSMLPNMAAGLDSILFAIGIDNEDFNTIRPASGLDTLLGSASLLSYKQTKEDEQRPVISGEPLLSPQLDKRKERRRRKKPAQIISFDNDSSEFGSYTNTPLTTPIQKHHSLDTVPTIIANSGVKDQPKELFKSTDSDMDKTRSATVTTAVHGTQLPTVPTESTNLVDSGVDFSPASQSAPSANENEDSKPFQWPPTTITAKEKAAKIIACDNQNAEQKVGNKSCPTITPSAAIPIRSEAAGSSLQNSLVEESILEYTMKRTLPESSSTVSMASKSSSVPPVPGGLGITQQIPAHKTPSVLSLESFTGSPSQASLTSLDDVVSKPESGTVLTPLSPEGQLDKVQILPASFSHVMDDSASCDSSDLPSYTDDTESAAVALSIAQKGLLTTNYGLRTEGDGSYAPDPVVSNSQDMTADELRQAIVAMMIRKEDIERQNKSLQTLLHQERDCSESLRLEIKMNEQSSLDAQEREQTKSKGLSRENELLKHQLKKYVSAVQMLRQNPTASSIDLQGIHVDEVQPSVPPSKALIDYSHEATEFEKKLIQVAEMHGELMEFNEHLHKQLHVRDQQLARLKHELTELRGPLPAELQMQDDNISIYSEMETTPSGHPLVHLWIPSAFLKGATSDAFHVYQVYVRIKDSEWNVYRRYKDFHDMHSKLKKEYPLVSTLIFPPKKTLGNREEKFVEMRRRLLQQYIRQMMNIVIAQNPVLAAGATKASLIQQMPFFGNSTNDKRKSKRRSTPGAASSAPSPQYMGL